MEPISPIIHPDIDSGEPQFSEEAGTSNWMLSYADMMTSMVVFLVLLLSFSRMDPQKMEEISRTAREENSEASGLTPSFSELQHDLKAIAGSKELSVEVTREGALITVPESMLFASGDALVDEVARGRMQSVSRLLHPYISNHDFIIEGHTDDNVVRGGPFKSNWELSAARGLEVMRLMREGGIPEERMSIQAYGAFLPLKPNRDAKGSAIPEHQATNRRAVIKIKRRIPNLQNQS